MSERRDINTALASAYGGATGVPRKRRGGHTFAIVMLVVFFIVMMTCLVIGVSIYRGVSDARVQSDELHMESGLLVNIVRMNDSADAVRMAEGPEGDALVLVERLESGTYETRLYLHDGAIVQEYAIAGRPLNPDNALEIVASDVFEFTYDDGLLSIMTDGGVFHAALRSQQGDTRLASAGSAAIETAAGVGVEGASS